MSTYKGVNIYTWPLMQKVAKLTWLNIARLIKKTNSRVMFEEASYFFYKT